MAKRSAHEICRSWTRINVHVEVSDVVTYCFSDRLQYSGEITLLELDDEEGFTQKALVWSRLVSGPTAVSVQERSGHWSWTKMKVSYVRLARSRLLFSKANMLVWTAGAHEPATDKMDNFVLIALIQLLFCHSN